MGTTTANKAENDPQPHSDGGPKTANVITEKTPLVALDELAREMKIPARDARMLLRLAAKQTKLYPTLGKEHVARQPWQWTEGSKSLDEARRALAPSE